MTADRGYIAFYSVSCCLDMTALMETAQFISLPVYATFSSRHMPIANVHVTEFKTQKALTYSTVTCVHVCCQSNETHAPI